MKSAWFSTALLSVFFISLFSCTKNSDDAKSTSTGAGKGGSVSLHVTPQHDGVNIDSCLVYIKYNANVMPASTYEFDDSSWCQIIDNTPVTLFDNLKKGQYLLYAKGWDKVRSQTVSGLRPYTITTDNTVYTLDLQLHN